MELLGIPRTPVLSRDVVEIECWAQVRPNRPSLPRLQRLRFTAPAQGARCRFMIKAVLFLQIIPSRVVSLHIIMHEVDSAILT